MDNYQKFQHLHRQQTPLLLPNAWDVLSAKILAQTGYEAIASTSYGVANAYGHQDGERISFEQLLSNARNMVQAVEVPVSIDVESGFGQTPGAIAENILKIAETGVVGINIEDSFKNEKGLRPIEQHGKIIENIRTVLNTNGYPDFFINARIDTHFQGKEIVETIARAKAYLESGANGIFVPGLYKAEEIKEIATTVSAPLNVMALPNLTDIGQLTALGVKRYSIGNALSDAVIAFIEKMAEEVRDTRNSGVLFDHAKVKTVFKNDK